MRWATQSFSNWLAACLWCEHVQQLNADQRMIGMQLPLRDMKVHLNVCHMEFDLCVIMRYPECDSM